MKKIKCPHDKTLKVFPFKVGDIVAHIENAKHPTEQIVGITPCFSPFGESMGEKCENCIPKLLMKVKGTGWNGTGHWCCWNGKIMVWKKVKEPTFLPHPHLSPLLGKVAPSWFKKPVGLIKDLVLDDGDVLLVHIPTDWHPERHHALGIYLAHLFEKQGYPKRNITYAVVTDDIKFSVLKVGKGESKKDAIKARFRLIRLGEEE